MRPVDIRCHDASLDLKSGDAFRSEIPSMRPAVRQQKSRAMPSFAYPLLVATCWKFISCSTAASNSLPLAASSRSPRSAPQRGLS